MCLRLAFAAGRDQSRPARGGCNRRRLSPPERGAGPRGFRRELQETVASPWTRGCAIDVAVDATRLAGIPGGPAPPRRPLRPGHARPADCRSRVSHRRRSRFRASTGRAATAGFEHSWVTPAARDAGSRTRERRCHSHPRREARSRIAPRWPRRRSRGARGAAIPGRTSSGAFARENGGRGRHRRRRRAGGGGHGRDAAAAGRSQGAASSPRTSDALCGRDQPLPRAVRRTVGKRAAALDRQGTPPHLLRWIDRGSCALDRC